MKRLVIPLLLLLPLCACAPESTVLEPVRIQTAAFDLEEARALIEPLERPMAEISVRESVTQAEYAAVQWHKLRGRTADPCLLPRRGDW